MNYKLPKDIKRRMEREIRQYENNKKRLEKLTEKDSTNRYFYLEQRISYVNEVYKRLRPQEQEVFKLIFKNGCNWLYCKTMYNIDKDTYYLVYNKSLYYLAEEFGEI